MKQQWILLQSIFLLVIGLLAGCASTYNEMDKWMGHKVSEIVSVWGAASSTYDNQDGTKMLTWKKYNFDHDKTCTKSFTINEQGIIIAHSDLDCSMPISFNFGNNQN